MNESESSYIPSGPYFLRAKDEEIDEEEDVLFFRELGHVLGWIEEPEVKDGHYRLWDSTGRRATLGTKKWDVIVTGWSEPEPDELKTLLSACLLREGFAPPNRSLDVPTFVATVTPIFERLEELHKARWVRAIENAATWLRGHLPGGRRPA